MDDLLGTKHTRQIKYCLSVVESIKDFAKKTYNLDLSYEEDKDAECMDFAWGLNFGGVYLYADENFSSKGFSTGYETYSPGSYWEPPDSDYVEHTTGKTLRQAMGDIISLLIMNEYELYIENEWAKDAEQYGQEYETKDQEEDQTTISGQGN